MRISDWSSDVCSSDLIRIADPTPEHRVEADADAVLPALVRQHLVLQPGREDEERTFGGIVPRIAGVHLVVPLDLRLEDLGLPARVLEEDRAAAGDRKSTRLNSSH